MEKQVSMKKVKVVNARSWYICHEGEIFDVMIEHDEVYSVSYRSGVRSIPKCDCEELPMTFLDMLEVKMQDPSTESADIIGDWDFFQFKINKVHDNDSHDKHYDNSNGSLYKFAQDQSLNAWEFDIIKRVVRCRSKGQFVSDLEKTKRVIDLYLKEYGL
jgi:hypothetical protein